VIVHRWNIIAQVAYAANRTVERVEKLKDFAIYQIVGKSRLLLGNSKQSGQNMK